MKILCAVLVLFYPFVNCNSSFPNSVARCKFGDAKCLVNTINEVVKSSPEGIPELGLASIDPLVIGKTSIEQGATNGPVSIKLRLKDAILTGTKNLIVTKVVGFGKDPNKSKFEMYGHCPSVSIIGTYRMNGKVLVLPVSGQGAANISFSDNDISIKITTHTENRSDGEYLIIDKVIYDATAAKMFINLDNLLNDPTISVSMNEFFNENQDILYKELRQSMNGIFGNILKKGIQNVFDKFPYSHFFTE